MSIITVFNLSTMDSRKYNQAISDLEAAGHGKPKGRPARPVAVPTARPKLPLDREPNAVVLPTRPPRDPRTPRQRTYLS
jgi:hypothetical protein